MTSRLKEALQLLLLICLMAAPARALEPVQVAEGVYAIVGAKEQRSAANLANNATFGLVVTNEGAVLVDPGGSWKGAEALDAAIGKLTDQKVKYVINTGGQDHRWLGNGYWRAKGAKIIASKAAIEDQKARASLQLSALSMLIGDGLAGTEPAYADIVFEETHELSFGGATLAIRHAGAAHTPGDSFVWLKDKETVFSGDIVYVDRLLGVLPFSKSKSWIAAFETMAALAPAHIVPGHGAPCDLSKARAQSYDYLVNLRQRIGEHIEKGGDMQSASKVDQSAFAAIEQFDVLAGRNAQQVFAEMEFE